MAEFRRITVSFWLPPGLNHNSWQRFCRTNKVSNIPYACMLTGSPCQIKLITKKKVIAEKISEKITSKQDYKNKVHHSEDHLVLNPKTT